MGDFSTCVKFSLSDSIEGGYVNHPKDPGGATMRGVTQGKYHEWLRKKGRALKPVRGITHEEVLQLYREEFWDLIQGDKLPSGIDLVTFDYAINSGVQRAVKSLQAALGLVGDKNDGVVGAQTISAAKEAFDLDADLDVIDKILDERLAFMKRARNRKSGALLWDTFGGGWGKRIGLAKSEAHRLEALADIAQKASRHERENSPTTIIPVDPVSYNPAKAEAAVPPPEPARKAGNSGAWAGGLAAAGAAMTFAKEFKVLVDGTLPATILGGVVLLAAAGFGYVSYRKSREDTVGVAQTEISSVRV